MFGRFRRRKANRATATIPRRLRELEIITARLIRAGFAGQYQAAFLGRGIEFFQVREYQPGDDVRTIDWNVTARSGVPHVKQFVEERDLTVVLAIDLSGSMRFGSQNRRKIDIAVELASVLSFAALQNKDRVGLLLFSDDVVQYVPPRRGRVHTETMVRTVLTSARNTVGRASYDGAVDYLERVMVRRAVVIVISDFFGDEYETALRQLDRRHDVVAIRIVDPREMSMPRSGFVVLRDAETGKDVEIDLARARMLGPDLGSAPFDERMRRIGVDALTISTAVPYEQKLIRFFGSRRGRSRSDLYEGVRVAASR